MFLSIYTASSTIDMHPGGAAGGGTKVTIQHAAFQKFDNLPDAVKHAMANNGHVVKTVEYTVSVKVE